MATKYERAKARKAEYLAKSRKVDELEKQLKALTAVKSEKPPQRRGSVSQFLREMFVNEERLEPKTRRNSATTPTPAAVVAAAAKPKHNKTVHVPSIPGINEYLANEDPLARALRRGRRVIVRGELDNDDDDEDMPKFKYAKNKDGTILRRCSFWQKLRGVDENKCDPVKLTEKEREKAKAQYKASKAKNDYRVEIPDLAVTPDGDLMELSPAERQARQKAARQEENRLFVSEAQARAQEEAARLGLANRKNKDAVRALMGTARLPSHGAPPVAVDIFAGVKVVDRVDPSMKPGDAPVLGERLSLVKGEQVRLRFVPPGYKEPQPRRNKFFDFFDQINGG